MREESHLDDMRAAIRGDFERLAKRRGNQELMRDPVQADEPAEELADEPAEEPVAEPVVEPAAEREPAPASPEPAQELVASADVEPPDTQESTEEAPRRSFLDRLLGR